MTTPYLTLLTKPMKAPSAGLTEGEFAALRYPVQYSPKLDGIRATVQGGRLLSNTLKPIPNKFCQELFARPELEGFDGELVVGPQAGDGVFGRTTSGVMSIEGKPDVIFHVFDTLSPIYLYKSYEKRRMILESYFDTPEMRKPAMRVLPWLGSVAYNQEELVQGIAPILEAGYEGVMVRPQPDRGFYRGGRTTYREALIHKIKPLDELEAEVVGFAELMRNTNPSLIREDGYARKSSSAAGLVGVGTLGALVLHHPKWGTFRCGSGFTEKQRAELWAARISLLGRIVTVKYQKYGSKDAPRAPIFKGFRHMEDISAPNPWSP